MAEAEYNSDEGTEAVLGSNDHRLKVDDRSKSKHPVHSAIFQVRAVCVDCQSVSPGTCFMVEELNRMLNMGGFYYFVTAGHVIYCTTCRHYRDIQISYEWEPQDPLPKISFMPLDEYVEKSSTRGWLSVPDGYTKNCGKGKSERDRYPFDYGVIAMRKDELAQDLRSELDKLVAAKAMLRAPSGRDEFVPRAFLCGYPGEVKTVKVRGIMYWVPEESSEKGEPLASESNHKVRKLKERSKSCLYAMPQVHMGKSKTSDGEGTGSSDTNAPLAVERLFRHYIDSSPGQSGSPVYEMSDDKEDYKVVGIHLGFWKIEGAEMSYACNVALRMSEVVMEMKQWIRDNHDKTPVSDGKKSGTESFTESFAETFYKNYLLSTGIEGAPPKHGPEQPEQSADSEPGTESNPWEDLEFLTKHRGWITSLPAASLQEACFKAGLITKQAEIKKLMKITDEQEHNAYILALVIPGGRQSYEIFLAMLQRMNPLYKKKVESMAKILNR